MSKNLVSNQPFSLSSMDLYSDFHNTPNEKGQFGQDCCSHQQRSCASRNKSRKALARRLIFPAIILLIVAAAFLYLSYFSESEALGPQGFVKRAIAAVSNSGSSNRTQSSFVRRKLYIIVIVVGFFLVLLAAVMLSAWCCKGSFENPLCCPCYLCACCGGLACLECIACGLCAEGLENA